MGKVKLFVVSAGHQRWRLATDRDAAQYLREFTCTDVEIILPGVSPFHLTNQMNTYRRYLSLSHREINRWIINRHWNVHKSVSPTPHYFNFRVNGTTHIYEYL